MTMLYKIFCPGTNGTKILRQLEEEDGVREVLKPHYISCPFPACGKMTGEKEDQCNLQITLCNMQEGPDNIRPPVNILPKQRQPTIEKARSEVAKIEMSR